MTTILAVEDLQPIADKLSEASQKIYEAVQLAAELGIKPRQLASLCNVIEHIERTQLELLEAAKRTPNPLVETGFNRIPPYSQMTQFEIPMQAVEGMRQHFLEQMERGARASASGMTLMRDRESEMREKIKNDIAMQYLKADQGIAELQNPPD